MTKQILYNDNARQALVKGMSILVKAVGVTLGPKGKNVVLERKFGVPQIINDGITIAKEIELRNHVQNIGVALIRQAALKTNDVAGDGTTTATVLAHAIVKQGIKSISSGSNPVLIKKGIEKAIHFIADEISKYSRSVTCIQDIVHIASISAGNDLKIGHMISEAIKKVGREGIISLEEAQSTHTHLEILEGTSFNKGFISPYFLSSASKIDICQENPLILLTDKKITLAQPDMVLILEQVAKIGRPLLIIADDIAKEALATLVINKLRGIVDVVAVRTPGFGDRRRLLLEDIAILVGAQVLSDNLPLNLSQSSLEFMGSAKRVIVSRSTTTIIAGSNNDAVQLRCSHIRKQINATTNSYEKEKLQERLSKLSGRAAVIKFGAATEAEMQDKKLRLEDAINATKAAIQEGVLPGGGSALAHFAKSLDFWSTQYLFADEFIGAQIVARALCIPLQKIVDNAGCSGTTVVKQVQENGFSTGYDASKGLIVDMYEAGILDPAKVTRLALQNASSIASVVLTTECLVADKLTKIN